MYKFAPVAIALAALFVSTSGSAQEQFLEVDYEDVKFLYRDADGRTVNLRDYGLHDRVSADKPSAFAKAFAAVQAMVKAREGGLAGAAARLAAEEFRQERPVQQANLTWKRVRYVLQLSDPANGAGIIDLSVRRDQGDGTESSERWLLAVTGGLQLRELLPPKPNHNDPRRVFRFQLEARGEHLQMLAYWRDGKLTTDRKAPVYRSSPESCVQLFTESRPDPAASLEYDSGEEAPPDQAGLWFGRCASPGIFVANM